MQHEGCREGRAIFQLKEPLKLVANLSPRFQNGPYPRTGVQKTRRV